MSPRRLFALVPSLAFFLACADSPIAPVPETGVVKIPGPGTPTNTPTASTPGVSMVTGD